MRRSTRLISARLTSVLFTLPLVLSACGENFGDRVISGAGIGALAGAAAASVVHGGRPANGLMAGAVVGAAVGGVVPANHLNAGTPIWRMQF